MPRDEVIGLFPIPLLRAPATLDAALVQRLVDYFAGQATLGNNTSPRVSHTQMLTPADSPLLVEAARLIVPKLAGFGAHLFGEQLTWALKEMWVNVLEPGGHQAMHNHANSFVSGVLYLTRTHEGSHTVFMKSPGGSEFMFRNDHARVVNGEFNADKWVSPAPEPGDMVLFPSYLMHAVPPNQGERRITLAFNAIPSRLDSWGYAIRFG
jgi:uncharacterized protein (TIGR02466 family)